MPNWLVVTPYFDCKEPILDDGSGPTYSVRDVIQVEANNKSQAISRGVKLLLDDKRPGYIRNGYVQLQRGDNRCPYTGVTAMRIEDTTPIMFDIQFKD